MFPPWVAELGEVALIILDFVWHHEIVESIHEVDHQVSDMDDKLDALLAASPTASQVFLMRKSHKEEPVDWPTPPIGVRSSIDKDDDDIRKGSLVHFVWAVTVAAIKLANWVTPLIIV